MALYTDYTDEQLVALLKNSDEGAFTEIYDRYWEKCFFVGASKLASHAVVEELVQDVFCDLWDRRLTLQLSGVLGAYLAVAVKYRVINAQAKQRRARAYIANAMENHPAADRSPEDILQFEELKDQLAALVANLPEQGRLVFQLSREEDLSYREIAQEMNITEKAVERSLARAVHTLNAQFRQFFFFLFLLFIFFIFTYLG